MRNQKKGKMLTFGHLSLIKITWVKNWCKVRFFMRNNKICGKLRKGANFAAAKKKKKNHDDTLLCFLLFFFFIKINVTVDVIL